MAHATLLRYDPYFTRQNTALHYDTANDCDTFMGRILEHFGQDRRMS
jgi:hypothetical protein